MNWVIFKNWLAKNMGVLTVAIVTSGAISGAAITSSVLTAGRVPIAGTAGLIGDDADLTFLTDTLSATKVATSNVSSGQVPVAGAAGLIGGDADLTFATDTLSATKVASSSLTSGRVSFAGAAGLLSDDADLTFATATLTSTGLAVGSTGLSITGTTTMTGGLVATVNRLTTIPIGAVAYASVGTSAVHVAGTIYSVELWVPANKTITGVGVLNGATVGTDNLIVALANSAGTVVATSALAGALSSGANVFQEIALTATYAAVGPGRYWVIVQCNGTTATTRRIAASTYLPFAGSAAGVFGTLSTITPPTSTTADTGPIAYVY